MVALGYALARRRPLDTAPLSLLLMNVFSPALSATAILDTPLTGADAVAMVAFTLGLLACTLVLGWLGARVLRLDTKTTTALLVSALVLNTGNYGASAALFAFGREGFQQAIVFMAVQFFASSAVAIYLCARGHQGARQAFLTLLRQPIVLATVAAALCKLLNVPVPAALAKAVRLLGDANVPAALLLLGMHLSRLRFARSDLAALGLVSVLRLVVLPGLALVALAQAPVEPLLRSVLAIQATMPTAVNAVVYAAEFDMRPDLVGAAVVATTLLSLLTVTGWLSWVIL